MLLLQTFNKTLRRRETIGEGKSKENLTEDLRIDEAVSLIIKFSHNCFQCVFTLGLRFNIFQDHQLYKSMLLIVKDSSTGFHIPPKKLHMVVLLGSPFNRLMEKSMGSFYCKLLSRQNSFLEQSGIEMHKQESWRRGPKDVIARPPSAPKSEFPGMSGQSDSSTQ
ncbi:hypothetical protein E5288_WYG014276 [Bos mutus]|uniref:Uncharacterized protein n=1 Tax=Bos mutus TaxID=72004 RepID=A0A6B0R763_9CETA|nr:hypothetical protein [Bos mutus]